VVLRPAGACGTCDGLGVQQYFDPARVIQDESLSLAQGAIRGWDQKNYYYFQMLSSLAKHYVILTGSGRTEVEFNYINDRGDIRVKRHPFEGILNTLERRYRDTESNSVREDLVKHAMCLLVIPPYLRLSN